MDVHPAGKANTTVFGYVPNPEGRGTMSLLLSCLLTLSLCVWSSVHLNLPRHDESDFQHGWRYLKWSALGVFGPELVVWAAWRQYISAKALARAVQEEHRGRASSNGVLNNWSAIHGFYAGMGGFVFDLTSPDMTNGQPFVPPQRRLHLTPRGILLLAKCGLLPNVPEADIKDKSKTDSFGKIVCCLQVSWMIVQAIARLLVGLPVTPLETNTIGHVFCALITYGLWWYKPRWVREPTILSGPWVRPICAFMYMSSQVSAANPVERQVLRDFGIVSELSEVMYIPEQPVQRNGATAVTTSLEPESPVLDHGDPPATLQHLGPLMHLEASHSSAMVGESGDRVCGIIVPRRGCHPHVSAAQWDRVEQVGKDCMAATQLQKERWKLACEAIAQHAAIRERFERPPQDAAEQKYREALRLYPEMPKKVKEHLKHTSSRLGDGPSRTLSGLVCSSEELVVQRPRNWPGDDLVRHMQGHLMGIFLWLSSTVYGAVHLAGWNEPFPTQVETWFWRASAAYIVFSGVLWSSLNFLAHVSGSVWWFWYDMLAGSQRHGRYLLYILCCVGGALYVVARVYLAVEAFVSLRALPASAYASPSWILTVPHF